MSKTPFMPLWNGDILADTLEMDATEFGAFLLLIIAQWQRKGESLPSDLKRLQRVARVGRAWPKVWGNIQRFFDTDDQGVYSRKCRILFQNVALKTIVNSQNGARGGAAKALKNNDTGLANAKDSLKRNASIPEPEPYKDTTGKPVVGKTRRGTRLADDWFLPMDWGEWAVDQGLSQDRIRLEADKFRNYWVALSGSKATKLNWEATWRNWILNAKGRGNGNGTNGKQSIPQGRGNGPDPALAQIARLAGIGGAQGDAGC